jgi:hypothetical protein
MKNLRIVFSVIKKHCKEAGATDENCFRELEKLPLGRQLFLSLYLYIEVLQGLQLIKFCNYTKGITLTEKGKVADIHSIDRLQSSVLLFLYFLRRIFLFILFWPMFLVMPAAKHSDEKNSAG